MLVKSRRLVKVAADTLIDVIKIESSHSYINVRIRGIISIKALSDRVTYNVHKAAVILIGLSISCACKLKLRYIQLNAEGQIYGDALSSLFLKGV